MELLFTDRSLQTTLESAVMLTRRFGVLNGELVQQRVCELLAADSLAVVADLATLDMRADHGMKPIFSVQLTEAYRLRLEPAIDPIPRVRGNDQVDLARVDVIRIVGLEESK